MTTTDFDPSTYVLDDIAGDYSLDPAHSRLGFSARHAMVATVRGQFDDFTEPRTSTPPIRPTPRSR